MLKAMSGYLSPTLNDGEEVLWQGRPGALAYARKRFLVASYGGVLLWFVDWTTSAVPQAADTGAAFLLSVVGWFCVVVPILAYVRAKWWTVYTLTNQRLLWSRRWPMRQIYALPLQDVTFLNVVSIMPNNTGTIRVHAKKGSRPRFELGPAKRGEVAWLLVGVEKPQAVLRKLREVSSIIIKREPAETHAPLQSIDEPEQTVKDEMEVVSPLAKEMEGRNTHRVVFPAEDTLSDDGDSVKQLPR